MDEAAFAHWLGSRCRHYMTTCDVRQTRHLKVLCFWELRLGRDAFSRFWAEHLTHVLGSAATEEVRLAEARKALEVFLTPGRMAAE